MSIRVLHVIDHLGFGGAPTVVKNVVEKLGSDRYESIVCALRTNPRAMPINAKVISLTFGKYNPFAFSAIAKLCREHEIDVVHAHLQKSIVSCLIASFFCKVKIIIHEHGPIFRGGTGSMYRLLLRLLGSRTTAAIANSQATRSALSRTTGLDPNSIVVVGNFIDFARFDPVVHDRDKARKSLGIASDRIVVGFVGRLDICKGADLLVEAAAILCGEDQRYHFLIAGEGSERPRLESMARKSGLNERITFTGLCENPEEIIPACDVGVVPSRREAFGIAAIEFMRMKVPVVASAVGGLVEVVQRDKTGILLDELRAADIAYEVARVVGDGSLRQRLADEAELFSRQFDGQKQLKAIADIYEKSCS